LEKAAVDEGFGLRRPEGGEWLVFGSIDAPASIRLTFVDGAYVLAIDHAGVSAELALRWEPWQGPLPGGFTGFVVRDTGRLHHLVREAWRLARSLPAAPLRAFETQTRGLPRATEAERITIQRIGQNIFRDALLEYWNGACAVLGVTESCLLRASHIKPWAECATDAERLDVYNGLLLTAHLDAAFDAHLISFGDDGRIVISQALSSEDRARLHLHDDLALRTVAPAHLPRLAEHRTRLVLRS
jgi:hypothetical protein